MDLSAFNTTLLVNRSQGERQERIANRTLVRHPLIITSKTVTIDKLLMMEQLCKIAFIAI